MLDLPLLQSNAHPKSVNTKGDQGECPPFDPIAKQLDGLAVKAQPLTVDHRVLDFPVVNHAAGPGVTDAKGANGNQSSQQVPANQLQQAAVKVRVVHKLISFLFLSFYSQRWMGGWHGLNLQK